MYAPTRQNSGACAFLRILRKQASAESQCEPARPNTAGRRTAESKNWNCCHSRATRKTERTNRASSGSNNTRRSTDLDGGGLAAGGRDFWTGANVQGHIRRDAFLFLAWANPESGARTDSRVEHV